MPLETVPRRAAWCAALVAGSLLFGARTVHAEGEDGFYGSLHFTGMIEPFGSGTDMQRHCEVLGAADCGTPAPLGGGLFGTFGVRRRAFGLEAMAGGLFDFQRPSAHFDGVPHRPHQNPLLSIPARDETFILFRGGTMLAARVRYTTAPAALRGSFAGGVGVAYRYMALEREVTTTAGLEDRPYFASGTHYLAPALSVDAEAWLRATPTLAVAFGLGVWMEDAGSDTRAGADPSRTVAGNGQVAPIATPAYEMAHGVQIFVLPHVGLVFGP